MFSFKKKHFLWLIRKREIIQFLNHRKGHSLVDKSENESVRVFS